MESPDETVGGNLPAFGHTGNRIGLLVLGQKTGHQIGNDVQFPRGIGQRRIHRFRLGDIAAVKRGFAGSGRGRRRLLRPARGQNEGGCEYETR